MRRLTDEEGGPSITSLVDSLIRCIAKLELNGRAANIEQICDVHETANRDVRLSDKFRMDWDQPST